MVTLKSEATDDLTSYINPSATQELETWGKLVFAFDMDREQPSNSGNNEEGGHPDSSSRRRDNDTNPPEIDEHLHLQYEGRSNVSPMLLDVQDAVLSAQFAAGTAPFNPTFPAGMLHHSQFAHPAASNPNYYNQFFVNPSNQHLPPLSSLDFSWPFATPNPLASASQFHGLPSQPQASTSGSNIHAAPLQPPHIPQDFTSMSSGPSTSQHPRQSSQSSTRQSSSSPEVEMTDAERIAMMEEKRRRNTAASARFRVKKKHKTLTLERSVSELTGRAEELEREVADLRRENGWLKEIVMLKGTRFASNNFNHQLALNQAAALASGQVIADGKTVAGPTGTEEPEDSSDEESETSEEEEAVEPKGKGKAKKTSKK